MSGLHFGRVVVIPMLGSDRVPPRWRSSQQYTMANVRRPRVPTSGSFREHVRDLSLSNSHDSRGFGARRPRTWQLWAVVRSARSSFLLAASASLGGALQQVGIEIPVGREFEEQWQQARVGEGPRRVDDEAFHGVCL